MPRTPFSSSPDVNPGPKMAPLLNAFLSFNINGLREVQLGEGPQLTLRQFLVSTSTVPVSLIVTSSAFQISVPASSSFTAVSSEMVSGVLVTGGPPRRSRFKDIVEKRGSVSLGQATTHKWKALLQVLRCLPLRGPSTCWPNASLGIQHDHHAL